MTGSRKPRTGREQPPPPSLEVHTFLIDGEEYALLRHEALPDPTAASLTDAERDVLALALQGLSNEQIGIARNTRPRTVANQIASIFRKLNVSSRLELFALAARGRP